MMEMFKMFAGKKTYILLAVGAMYVFANKFLGVSIPGVEINPQDWLADLFMLGVGGTMRAGVSKMQS